jgi:protein-S-isoprenylcysteine O-methyltransferase Ste14
VDAPGQRRGWALLGSVLFFGLAPGAVDALVPWWITGWQAGPPFPGGLALRVAGLLLVIGGTIVLVESFLRFALSGLGTPAPVFPTRHLVVNGYYRYVRNPMYVANVAIILGQGLWFASISLLVYCALVWLSFHAFVMLYEEPKLRTTYGAEYDAFCRRVPRWIPRFRRDPSASAKGSKASAR